MYTFLHWHFLFDLWCLYNPKAATSKATIKLPSPATMSIIVDLLLPPPSPGDSVLVADDAVAPGVGLTETGRSEC
jgi:hypothetical protein